MKSEFTDYLGNEESNLLVNMANHGDALRTFAVLDKVFIWPMKYAFAPKEMQMISSLYLFTHTCLYSSVSSLLRCHEGEAYSSLRRAIEAALHAYRISSKPESESAYEDGAKEFESIKRTLNKDKTTPPLIHLTKRRLNLANTDTSPLTSYVYKTRPS